MKPIKVDKATQKAFEEYGEFQQQNDGLMNALMTTMDRINWRLSEASRSVWGAASKKYKLDPTKQHVYNNKRKEIIERGLELNAEAQKDEEWLKRQEDMLKGYNKMLERCESLAKFTDPKKQETRIRLKIDDTGAMRINLDADSENKRAKLRLSTPDEDWKKLTKLLRSTKENEIVELVFKEKG